MSQGLKRKASVEEENERRNELDETRGATKREEYKYDANYEKVLIVEPLGDRITDVKLLAETFEELGFKYKTARGMQSADHLARAVRDYAAECEDVFICVIAADGDENGILNGDGSFADYEHLISIAASMPSLDGKPKVFVFDGDRSNESRHVKDFCDRGGGERLTWPPRKRRKAARDTVVAFSTTRGGLSHYYKPGCSLVVKYLCEELLQSEDQRELTDVFEAVKTRFKLASGEVSRWQCSETAETVEAETSKPISAVPSTSNSESFIEPTPDSRLPEYEMRVLSKRFLFPSRRRNLLRERLLKTLK